MLGRAKNERGGVRLYRLSNLKRLLSKVIEVIEGKEIVVEGKYIDNQPQGKTKNSGRG